MTIPDVENNCFIQGVTVVPGMPPKNAPKGFSRPKECTVILTMTGDPTEAIRSGRFRADGFQNWSGGNVWL